MQEAKPVLSETPFLETHSAMHLEGFPLTLFGSRPKESEMELALQREKNLELVNCFNHKALQGKAGAILGA